MPDGSTSDLPLLILRLPSADAVPGAEALLTLSAQARIMENPAMAEAELAAASGARLVVICPAPEAWMALALAAGAAPSQAVREWRESVRPLMGVLRARRRQTVLLFDQTFASDPAACAAALGVPPPKGPVFLRQTDDPVLVMIARDALRGDPAAQVLAEELAATALSPAGTEVAPGQRADVIFESYVKGLQQQAASETEAGLLREQVRLDVVALDQMQAALSTERGDLLAQIGQLRESRDDLEVYYDHARKFSEQVDALTADLRGLQSALQAAQAEAAERAQHVAWLQDEITRIHGSRSYRLMTPLRKLRKTIG